MIKNAIIVGDQISPEHYNIETEPRGSAKLVVRSLILGEILRNADRWVRGYESPQTKSKQFGSIYDCLLLTPFQWPKRYAVVPSDAPKRPTKAQINAKKPSPETVQAIEWWEDWIAENPGEIVKQEDNAKVHLALKRLREDKLISELIETSQHAVMITAEWHDEPTGLVVPLKALLDVVPSGNDPLFSHALFDLKTTQNASPRSFGSDAQRYHFDLQGGFYVDLWNAATRQERTGFGHIIQENFHPWQYRTPPPLLSQRFLAYGQQCYQAALSIYCKALTTGKWPSYERGKEYPVTDCADYHLNMETLYPPLEEPEEEADGESETAEAPETETYGPN